MLPVLIALAISAAVSQPADWLPSPVYDGVVEQLSERLEQISLDWTAERRNNAAAVAVTALRKRLDAMSVSEVQKLAPPLTRLKLVQSGNDILNTMARYQMCNAADYVAFEHRAKETATDAARMNTVMRLTAGTMVVLYLRHHYISAGGSDEQVEKFLTSDSLQRPLDRMQDNGGELRAVQEECAPVFKSLMGR
jgi:hypothetical protein